MNRAGYTAHDEQRTSHGSFDFHPEETIEQYLLRMNEATSLQAGETVRTDPAVRIGWTKIFFGPFSSACRKYFIGKEYRKGISGFVAAALGGIATLSSHAKVWEYRMRQQEGKGQLPPVSTDEVHSLEQL